MLGGTKVSLALNGSNKLNMIFNLDTSSKHALQAPKDVRPTTIILRENLSCPCQPSNASSYGSSMQA